MVLYSERPLHVKPIVDGFTKLESLIVETCHLIVEDLDYLCDYRTNLKFVGFNRLENGLSDDLKQKLGARFAVINFDTITRTQDLRCTMAVDRYTMNKNYESKPDWPLSSQAYQRHPSA